MCFCKNSHLITPYLLGFQSLELMSIFLVFPGNQEVKSKVDHGFQPCILLAFALCLILPSSPLPCYISTKLDIKWYNN